MNIKLPSMIVYASALAVLFEIVFNVLIIKYVNYTEIDWIAYMQEVKGFLSGDWDYSHLHGQTGPLVYPSLFVYIYSILNIVTLDGSIIIGQYIFAAIYVLVFAVMLTLYVRHSEFDRNSTTYFWIIFMLMMSKRIHSIFVLRMFNDCIAMLFLYLAVLAFCRDNFDFGLFFFSCGLGVKMNILLFFPAVGVLTVQRFGFTFKAISKLVFYVVFLQLFFAIPFLFENAAEYFHYAFDFGREFTFKWTVNFKFLPEEIFVSKTLARSLLIGQAVVLLIFIFFKWCVGERFRNPFYLLFSYKNQENQPLNAHHILYVMFTSNFIGIMFARSLHYQFYVWYFHSLPFLLMFIPYFRFNILRLGLLLCIEYVWNVYPSTPTSSIILHVCHTIILVGLLLTPPPAAKTVTEEKAKTE